MKLSDKYEIVIGPHKADFVVRVWRKGKTKDGDDKWTSKDTYHNSLQSCYDKILKQECLEAVELESLQQVLDKIDEVKEGWREIKVE